MGDGDLTHPRAQERRAGELLIVCEDGSERVVLRLEGELDLASADAVREEVEARRAPGVTVAIDLADVAFMDSSGVTLLLGLTHDASRDGWRLDLHRPSAAVIHVVEMTGITDHLPLAAP